ncbi:hypothetical protein NDU88_005212 [Pleurodeles waltl]|uniref:Uncharacterized protein n=1 Tax=Pleurodeles waltl TaxID=8319 RepID=A0AAV7MG79_PLEWA|nr:hypothetical protein NDU88_005212 [Pleurodeles waltl]
MTRCPLTRYISQYSYVTDGECSMLLVTYGDPAMGKEKSEKGAQSNEIMQYTTTGRGSHTSEGTDTPDQQESSHDTTNILEAIRGFREALENNMGTMAMDTNHLSLDLCKIMKKVTTTEKEVATLSTTVQEMQTTISELKKDSIHITECQEDAEGCLPRNNLRLIGFLKQAEGPSAELFLEEWIATALQPIPLSKFFMLERAHRALGSAP